MNRRERRRVEKELGITKHKQSMNITTRLKSLHESAITGKERSAEAAENRRRKENEEADKQAAAEVSSLATTLMLRDSLSWYQAIEAAKKEIAVKKTSEKE